MQEIRLCYGRDGLAIRLPEKNLRHVLRLRPSPPLADVPGAVRQALQVPVGSPPLYELARGRGPVCLVLPDITRPLPARWLLPPILEALHEAGVRADNLFFLIATGLHREPNPEDLQEILGPELLAAGYRIESHRAEASEQHVQIGRSSLGTPLLVDRRYLEADFRILVSLIEPHLFAGYSGGRKMILPGLASAETICRFHGPAILEHEKVEMGRVGDNPVDRETWEAYHLAGGADFAVACTLDEQRRVTSLFAGDTRDVQIAGMQVAERAAKQVLAEPADIVITSNAGYPLDLTFYQGLKALTVGGKICRPGGLVIVVQKNEEGLGNPEFAELVASISDCHAWAREALAQKNSHPVDGWAVHQMEQVLREHRVLNYSALPADLQRQLFVEPIASVEAGVEQALAELGPEASLAVIPEGPYLLPCLRGEYVAEHTVTQMMARTGAP